MVCTKTEESSFRCHLHFDTYVIIIIIIIAVITNITIEGPLVLWLQGGPGWPSMFGMFKENGPFLIHVEREGDDVNVDDEATVKMVGEWIRENKSNY